LKQLAEDSVSEESEDDTTGVESKQAQSAADLLISGTRERPDKKEKKRKRGGDQDSEEELEDVYMRKLALEEAREDAKQKIEKGKKRLKMTDEDEDSASEDEDSASDAVDENDGSDQEEDSDAEESDKKPYTPPVHESLILSNDASELEKAARTVFLGNVSSTAIKSKSAKKTLLAHLASFIPSLPEHTPPHKVESIRFRSTAFAGAIPKKASFALKEVMDATTKSTNAYAVYTTQVAAREAARRLNGTVVLDRHLRVDEVAHPAKQDHRRCVFVGNLGFVDDESNIQAVEELENGKRSRKQKAPSDVEEGLWVQFSKAGTVESVRVVRDSKTRVGKGIAYVQFKVLQTTF
jgi:nucleolar protein 12